MAYKERDDWFDWKEDALDERDCYDSPYHWPTDDDAPPEQYDHAWMYGVEEEIAAKREALAARGLKDEVDPDPNKETLSVWDDHTPLVTYTAAELMARDLPRTHFVVEGMLPTGLSILSSPPKFGKSWMVMDLCLAVAEGRPFLGHEVAQGHSLYLALEDSENRLQERLGRLLQERPAPERFSFSQESISLTDGLLQKLENYMYYRNPRTSLIVIDTLQKIRGVRGREGVYGHDYREMGALKEFADRWGTTILLVHHLNKGSNDDGDPHSRINGSTAILGAADTSLVLTKPNRLSDEALLSITGRDVETRDLEVRFDKDSCRWSVTDAPELREAINARSQYERDSLVLTLRHLMREHDGLWRGNAASLITLCRERFGQAPAASSQQLNKRLRHELGPLLYTNDNITHRCFKNGNGGWIHEFRQLERLADEDGFVDPFL